MIVICGYECNNISPFGHISLLPGDTVPSCFCTFHHRHATLLVVYVTDLFIAQSAFPTFVFAVLLHLYFSQEIVAMESVLTARDLGCCKHPPDLRSRSQLGCPILVPKLTSQLRDKQSLQYYSYGHDYTSDETHKGFCRHNCRRGSLMREKNHWGASDCPVNICKHT